MKKNMTLAFAALILTLTLSAFPHYAAASSTTSSQGDSDYCRAGGSQVPYMAVELAAEILSSALLP